MADARGYSDILVAALGSGTIVALVNHLFTRRKTAAEVEKLKAEAEKLRVETGKLRSDVQVVSSAVQDVRNALADVDEIILFDSSAGIDGGDVIGEGDRLAGEPKERPKALGSVEVEQGVVVIRRTNREGRFKVKFVRYLYQKAERDFIPRNEMIAGPRKLRLTFEAKAIGGSHTLAIHVKSRAGRQKDASLAIGRVVVSENEWRRSNLFFRVPPEEDSFIRFDDQEVAAANSSVQVRAIVIGERTQRDAVGH